jgi:hypothetical protein
MSFSNMDVKSEITFTFDISLQVCHLEMVINPIHNEIWEPRVFSTGLEKFVKQFEAFLSEVISKDFEAHESLILRKSLSEQSQTHVVDLIVRHVQMDKTFVDSNSLCNSLGSVVAAFIISQMKGF